MCNSFYTYSLAETGPISSSATILNTGKSPALDILCRMVGIYKPREKELTDADIVYPPNQGVVKQGTIFPSEHFPLETKTIVMVAEQQKTWFENISNGSLIAYFYGEIGYKDVFGNDHWTHFCTQYVVETKSGTPCAIYNDTDDVQKNGNGKDAN